MLNLVTLVVAFSPSLFISLAPSFVFAPPHQMDYCNPTYTSSCQRQPCSQWLSTFAHQGPFISAKKYWICLFLRNLKSNHCKLKEFKNNEKIGVKAPICSAVSKKEFWLHPYIRIWKSFYFKKSNIEIGILYLGKLVFKVI